MEKKCNMSNYSQICVYQNKVKYHGAVTCSSKKRKKNKEDTSELLFVRENLTTRCG